MVQEMAVFKQLNLRDRTNANRIILHIDSAEPGGMRSKALRLGFPVNRILLRLKGERFSFGDYLVGRKDKFCFVAERKTIGDFVSSTWGDKRFFRQIKYMAEIAELLNMIPILYLVGSIREWRSKERARISRDYRKGKIDRIYEPASISTIEDNITEAHVRVLDVAPTVVIRQVANDIQLLRTFYGYALGAEDRRIGSPRPRGIVVAERKYAFQASVVATAFNIAERKARAIIDEYGSFNEFREEATENSLVYRVKGVGQVNAKVIMKRHRLLFE